MDCPFCEIIKTDPHDQIIQRIAGCAVIEPFNPVVEGHLLVIPSLHVFSAIDIPEITANTMKAASLVARRYESSNIITSIGEAATQMISHLHIHVVPRRPGDGLKLPWSTNGSEGA
jgi:histidine triad (HIT) family protein